MAKRRGRDEDSVYRRKDGPWVGQYKVQTPNGTKTKYIYSKTRKDAAAKLARAIADRESGLVFDCGSLTVEDYLVKWPDSVKGTVRERTWGERGGRGLHLVPALGKTRLDRLGALQLQSLYRSKLDSGLSARIVRMIHKALKQAVKWSPIPRNVTEAVDPPRERTLDGRVSAAPRLPRVRRLSVIGTSKRPIWGARSYRRRVDTVRGERAWDTVPGTLGIEGRCWGRPPSVRSR